MPNREVSVGRMISELFWGNFDHSIVRSVWNSLSAATRMDALEEIANRGEIDLPDSLERFVVDVLVNDSNSIVRHEAAFAVGRLMSQGLIRGKAAKSALMRAAVHDSSNVVRHEATEALWCFKGPDVTELLEKLSQDDDTAVSETARISLSRAGILECDTKLA